MRLNVALLVLLLAAPSAVAAPTARETHVVEVVQVPVYVSAPDGAVTGLTRDNFALFVNGKAQPFDYFDVMDFGRTAAPAPRGRMVPPDPRQRRLYLLLFDLYYTMPKDVYRAQRAAIDLIAHSGANDVFAVATYTYNRGIDVLIPFTIDRIAIGRALASLRPSETTDPLRLAIEEREARPIAAAFDRDAMPDIAQRPRVAEELAADIRRVAVDAQVGALTLLAQKLAPLEGQKHVVLLSAGYSGTLLHGVSEPNPRVEVRLGPLAQAQQFRTSQQPPLYAVNGPALMSLREMHRQYTAAGVFLDAIDVAGVRSTWTVAENESLYTLTRNTGGAVIDNRNDLGEAMQTLADRQRVVYVLGFHMPAAARKENKIEVRLRGVEGNPDVHYRPSFAPMPSTDGAENGLRLADIVLNDIPQSGMTVNATASGSTVSVSIPGRELLAQINEKNAQAEAIIYVFSDSHVVATSVKRIDIDAARAAAAIGAGSVNFAETFALPPGQYTAKVLVRLADSIGFTRTDFVVRP